MITGGIGTGAVLSYAGAVAAVGLAVLVFFREKKSFAQRAFVAGMGLMAVESVMTGLGIASPLPEDLVRWQALRFLVLSLVPGTWLLFSLSYSRGNFGEFLRKWKWAAITLFVVPGGVAILGRRRIVVDAELVPDTSTWILRLGLPGVVLSVILLLGYVAVLVNLEQTMRASVGTMRWRIKFMLLGVGVLFCARIYTGAQLLLYHSLSTSLEWLNACALLGGSVLILRSLRRKGLFEVDLYPSHGLIFGSITFLVVGIYLLAVGIFARAVERVGGPLAMTLKTLVVFAGLLALTVLLVSDRVRQRGKRFIGRHLRRPQYDYRQVWATFTQRTARITEVSGFCRAVTKVVSETFEALSVTVWLVEEGSGRFAFGASTALPEATGKALALSGSAAGKVIEGIRAAKYPVDMDASRVEWVETLKECNPGWFEAKGGHRVCVPLVASGEVLGLMAVGDRVDGLRHTVEEMDLLKTIGDQVGASLLNIKLSERLLESKQMEAFQIMSTFFVHDLKNTASSLSLMLENLPSRFEEPSFREDALRAISKSVERMRDLIQRLTLLREKLEIRAVEMDLDKLVRDTVNELSGLGERKPTVRLGHISRIMADPAQLQRVVVNLVRNAVEATDGSGEIIVETEGGRGWAILSVTDNGCGMSPEFVEKEIFRPFKSTKKQGLGIGLFQTRMIVEAHGGRMEVESEEGKGSTFRVLLPTRGG